MSVPAARRAESEAYQHADVVARQVRYTVGEQLFELVTDAAGMGSRGEFTLRLQALIAAEQRIERARGRRQQAREMGLPLAAVHEETLDAQAGLRHSVMELAKACAVWVAAMDYEDIRQTDAKLNGVARSEGKGKTDDI